MRCSLCGEDGFNGPNAIQKHRVDKHGAAPRVYGKKAEPEPVAGAEEPPVRRAYRRAVLEVIPADAETTLLASVTDLFVNAETDTQGDARVLGYLNARFGPEAYATMEETLDEIFEEEPPQLDD